MAISWITNLINYDYTLIFSGAKKKLESYVCMKIEPTFSSIMFSRACIFGFLRIHRTDSNFLTMIDVQLHWQTEGSRVSIGSITANRSCFSKAALLRARNCFDFQLCIFSTQNKEVGGRININIESVANRQIYYLQ